MKRMRDTLAFALERNLSRLRVSAHRAGVDRASSVRCLLALAPERHVR
jgi:hypothetical protein